MKFQDQDGTWKRYPPSFKEHDKERLNEFVHSHDAILTMRELAAEPTTPQEEINQTITLRHDVDHSIEQAVKFAQWEYDRGIRATYFVLHSAYYYKDRDSLYTSMRKLEELGHEVGLHLDTVNSNLDENGVPNYAAAAAQLDIELDELRHDGFDIVGSAAHGNPASKHNDCELFDNRFALSYFGLEYEAYGLQRILNANYISDNHGEWHSPLEIKLGHVTIMSMHPCHWPF